ncbi:MAG: hypothetical protein JOY71_30230 [Acetobacteraceae bacterium]|nr:hypothetical protein [Acetobacteraceae bacterium]
MKQVIFALLGVGALVEAVVVIAPASGQSDDEAAPIYGIKLPQGYRDWRLISVKQLTGAGGKLMQLRAELGNDLATRPLGKASSRSRTAQSLPRCIGTKTLPTSTTKS